MTHQDQARVNVRIMEKEYVIACPYEERSALLDAAEYLNGRMREELLNLEVFDSLVEAAVLIEDWRVEYNTYRPHRSLRMLTPAEFAAHWKQENEARLS